MPVEIEAKIKMGELESVRSKLRELSGRFLKTGLEVNIFFDTPEKNLLKGDRGLRIRSVKNLETGAVETVITYKGARAAGKLKSREERELKVDSLEDGCRLFEGLGYVQTIRFEKKRESWLLDDAKVELDTLPLLGSFLEVEAGSQEAVMAVVRKLGQEGGDFLTQSYAAMLDGAVKGDVAGGGGKVVVF
jgi:predicted adenylyl cyclase CyaB